MDTILVVNAGSSSVKFQVFSIEGEGKLRRMIKGQMDGIGSRPRLRASGADSDPLADRAYPIETVPDVPAAMGIAGGWLRAERSRVSWFASRGACDSWRRARTPASSRANL